LGYSKYPDQLDDSTSLPPSTDLVTAVNAEVVNRLRDAILALEQELDAQPSGTYGTVRARLDAMQAQIASEERQGAEGTVKISSTDTTFNFLEGKLVAGTNITIVRQNAGGDETLKISGSGGAHAITHEDGGSDEVTAQNLGSGAAVVDKVMVTDGAGGWTLEDYAAFVAHAPTHEDGGADEITAQNLGSGAAAIDQVMITDGAGGWTLGDYLPAHAATHEDGGVDEVVAQNLSSGAAPDGYVMVTNAGGWVLAGSAPPGAHAWTHEEGGVDELLAQDLGSGAAPDGYVIVADGLGGWVLSYNATPAPHAETHEQGGIDELVAQYLSSDGADDGYIMLADGLGGWRVASNGSKIVPGVSGYQDTQADSWEEVGGLIFNPLEFVGSTFEFEALIQTTIIAKAANIRLYNITDGAVVTDSVLSSTSLVPDLVSVVLTAPDDLPNGEKIYAVQVKMSIAGGPNERCICKAAHIKVS
jgi:hypothetical protein